jgi:hypothetical protein
MRKMQHPARFATKSTLTSPLPECRYAPENKKNRARIIYWFLTKTKFDPDQAAV